MTVDELMGMAEADPGLMDDLVHQLDQQSDPAIARCLAGRDSAWWKACERNRYVALDKT